MKSKEMKPALIKQTNERSNTYAYDLNAFAHHAKHKHNPSAAQRQTANQQQFLGCC